MSTTCVIWRRLDAPGHDACRLEEHEAGWILDGGAVFREKGVPASLSYRIECDRTWRSQRGRLHGWIGPDRIDFRIERTAGDTWTLNGVEQAGVRDCIDLDLAITPATNLIPIRRLALAVGQSADAPAAWLQVAATSLVVLPQHYERRTEITYLYEAPTTGFSGPLEVTPSGFARRYAGLWAMES